MFCHRARGRGREKSAPAVVAPRTEPLESRTLLSGTWTALAHSAPGPVGTMLLLPDGSVMAQINGTSADWAKLTPDSAGGYINGSWARLAPAQYTRLYGASQVLPSGNVFIAGAEYGTGSQAGEIYNPQTNSWLQLPAQNFGNLLDSSSEILPDGKILIAPVQPSTASSTILFDPSTNTWSTGPRLFRGATGDEQSWVKLADGSVLTIDGTSTSERYIPSLTQWVNDARLPVNLWDSINEMGPGVLLSDGRAFFIGASGHTAIYTPSGSSSPGTWTAGPDVPNGGGTPDGPAAVLPGGTVLVTSGVPGTYNGPTSFYLFDPTANSFSAVSGAPSIPTGPYTTRLLDLPDGSVLLTTGGATPYVYKPGTPPLASAKPTISINQPDGDGTYQLSGSGFNGNSEGAYYGDDAQMNSNYPLVRLTGSTGQVYFARSFNWSSVGVQTGNTPVTTQYALPAGLPSGNYSLNVAVNGFVSDPVSMTVPAAGDVTAPTIATPALASPSVVTGNTTTLSVLGSDLLSPESTLTYTWSVQSSPAGVPLPSFSANATNSAKNTNVTFYRAGTYVFQVFVADTGGLWTTSTVTVTVNQVAASLTVSPITATLSANATQQFNVSGTDQFGQFMASVPGITWSLAAGGGSISPTGLYTAPASGTVASISAAAGVAQGSAEVGVDTPPWVSGDMGPVAQAGESYDTGGVFTLEGSGSDIGSTSDQFRFTYQTLTGNASITARVLSQTNTNSSAKAGVMIRASTNAADPFAMLAITPSGGTFEYRSSRSNTAISNSFGSVATPEWVRLVQNGNVLSAYTSTDGSRWTQLGTITLSMSGPVLIGLAVCSHNNAALSTATFDNVSISQPSIATAPAVDANPVTGTTAVLSTLGADPAGESGLSYTWTATSLPAGAATPTFSINSCNLAKNTVATFSSAGTYAFTVIISDSSGLCVTSTTSIAVASTLTSISISPPTAAVAVGGTLLFGATPLDQFGKSISPPSGFTWSVSGTGNSISGGALTAGNTAGSFVVMAQTSGVSGTASLTVNSAIVGRYVFYNNSTFDGNDPSADARDDQAIAPGKQALTTGQTATFANYTSYTRGINGIMMDVAGLPDQVSASDFSFRMGTAADPSTWAAAPSPSAVLVRPGAGVGSSSRIEVTWPDGVIRNTWLQVTLAADTASGLASPDVFYFGNLVGSTGQPPPGNAFTVSSADGLSARNDPHTFLSPADMTDINDFNRDGVVDALDQLIARMNAGAALPALAVTPPRSQVNTTKPVSLARRRVV